MKLQKLSLTALVLLGTFVGGYGCSQEEPADEAAETNDEALLRKGSVDQAAIVESTTMMLASGPSSGELDPYNQQDPFRIQGSFDRTFRSRLAQFDGIDGKTDWSAANATAWVTRMSTSNYLVVDTSKPCDWQNPHTYLEIERAQLAGRPHQTCGGRMPNEDAMDVTLNFLIRGPSASVADADAFHDGVQQATKQSTAEFPYLAEMN